MDNFIGSTCGVSLAASSRLAGRNVAPQLRFANL
jgi:hypothetical protein